MLKIGLFERILFNIVPVLLKWVPKFKVFSSQARKDKFIGLTAATTTDKCSAFDFSSCC